MALHKAYQRARGCLEANRAQTIKVAEHLIKHGRIDAAAADRLLPFKGRPDLTSRSKATCDDARQSTSSVSSMGSNLFIRRCSPSRRLFCATHRSRCTLVRVLPRPEPFCWPRSFPTPDYSRLENRYAAIH